jgi:hypothetical protein
MKKTTTAWVMVPLSAIGCEVKDQEAPPKPRLATLRTPTALDRVVFQGSAEYGRRLR